MIYPSIDKLLTIIDSKYKLAIITAKRSRQIAETEHYQMNINDYESAKNIGRAMEEIAEGLVVERIEKPEN